MIRKGKKAYYRNERDRPEWWAVRREVLKRDGYRCQMPGCKKRSRLQVHHVLTHSNAISSRYTSSNLIVLCYGCHKDKVTNNEHHYASLFFRIISENEEKMRK